MGKLKNYCEYTAPQSKNYDIEGIYGCYWTKEWKAFIVGESSEKTWQNVCYLKGHRHPIDVRVSGATDNFDIVSRANYRREKEVSKF